MDWFEIMLVHTSSQIENYNSFTDLSYKYVEYEEKSYK